MAQFNYHQKAIQLSKWILDKVLFLNNLDLDRIYHSIIDIPQDTTTTTTTIEIEVKPAGTSLRNKSIRRHKQSRSCYLVLSTLVTYFVAKTSIINLLHLGLFKLDHGLEHCPAWWSKCRASLLLIRSTLGDPMSELGGGGGGVILFTWALSIGTFLFITVLPYYLRSNQRLDLASLRFFYEPEQELMRLDELIGSKLNELLDSLLNFHSIQLGGSSSRVVKPVLLVNHQELDRWESMIERIHQLLVDYKSDRRGFKRLRPEYFQESQRASKEVAWSFIGLYLTYFCLALRLIVPMLNLATGTRCATKSTECHLLSAFTWQEYIYLIETLVISSLIYLSFTFYTIVILVQLKSNSRLVANMKQDLISSLRHLKWYNIESTDSNNKSNHERRLERILIESFVKILVASDELRRGAGSTTHLLVPWFVQAFGLVCLFVVVDGVSSANTRAFERQILVAYWLMLNLLALICAGIASRAIQLQRLYWSIQAELIVYHQRLSMQKSFISLVWLRLSDYSRLISHLYTAKPLEISLTYRKIIEINFSIISVVSFLSLSNHALGSSSLQSSDTTA